MRKKKIVSSMRLARMAVMLILALLAVQTAQADTWDGTTRTQPTKTTKMENNIEIYSFIDINYAAELAYICEHWNEKYEGKNYYQWDYKLMVDIDMGDWSWTTLGNKAFSGNDSYDGTFDGDGHTIRINISGATDNYQGLFAKISSDGKVENLHVSGNIHCSTSRLVGGIAGENDGTISNCWVSADVRSDWHESWSSYKAKVGGIAGENNGTVEYCCMTGNVANNDAHVGGLVGCNDGTVRYSTFYGTVSSSHSQYNAFVGYHGTEESLYTDYNQGEYAAASGNDMYRNALLKPYVINISTLGEGTYVAKIGESTVTRAYPGQTITLTKTSEKALYGVTIKDADGNTISSTGDMNEHLEISMPRRDVNVTAIFYTTDWDSETLGTEENPYIIDKKVEWDKFAEKVNGGTTFSGKYVKLTANITVDNMVGCMAGSTRRSFNGHFDGGGNTINCQIEADKLDAAPFCYTQDATFKDLTLTGSVTITGDDYVKLGGIVAYATGTTTFTNCKVSTTLTASNVNFAGGFVGEAVNASFVNCTFDGKLLGGNGNTQYCGGFEGYAVNPTTLSNCLFKPSEATITAYDLRTFVCGNGNATFNNCYYTQALGTAQGKWVYVTEPSHGFYAPITFYDSNTYYLVIGTEGEDGGTKTYQITEDTDINWRIIVKGTVALNLDEGTTLHARRGIELSADNNANLTINGPGALTIDGCNEEKSGIGAKKVGTLVIKGGTLNVRGGKYAAGIGGDYYNTGGGSITINGGVVNAWGGYGSAGIGGGYGYNFTSTCGDIVINGGQVTAIGYWVYGIGPGLVYSNNEYHSGTLTLNLSNQDDFVYVNKSDDEFSDWSLNTITIASGKTLYDEDGVEHTSSNVGDIYGKTLRPYDYRLELSDNADNSAAIAAAANGKVYNVTLSGRTLSKSGEWNTLCLPFNVSAEQMTATTHPLYGAIIKELNATTSNLASDGTLTLNFTTANSIEAGKPYIVKWEGASGSVSNPVFTNVIIDATAPTPVTFANNANTGGDCKFVGQYSPFSIVASGATGNDQGNLNEILMLGSGSTLGYSKNERLLKTFRCHFYVPANGGAGARAFVMDFGDGDVEQTGIISITADQRSTDGATYTLDGRKLNGKPTAKGVYIQNGRKVVIK